MENSFLTSNIHSWTAYSHSSLPTHSSHVKVFLSFTISFPWYSLQSLTRLQAVTTLLSLHFAQLNKPNFYSSPRQILHFPDLSRKSHLCLFYPECTFLNLSDWTACCHTFEVLLPAQQNRFASYLTMIVSIQPPWGSFCHRKHNRHNHWLS